MAKNTGTPKTLQIAIIYGLVNADTVLMGEDEAKQLSHEIQPHVRDYISQAFAAAMLTAPTPEEEARLKVLFSRIVNEA